MSVENPTFLNQNFSAFIQDRLADDPFAQQEAHDFLSAVRDEVHSRLAEGGSFHDVGISLVGSLDAAFAVIEWFQTGGGEPTIITDSKGTRSYIPTRYNGLWLNIFTESASNHNGVQSLKKPRMHVSVIGKDFVPSLEKRWG